VPGGSGILAHGSVGLLPRRGLVGWRPRQDPHVAALLVDAHQWLEVAGRLPQAVGERPHLGFVDDVVGEQDHAGHPPAAQRVLHVAGRLGAREAQDDHAADLLGE
jgi:hypothetical protein